LTGRSVQQFFERPILNSPYGYPGRHWELDPDGQPTNRIVEARRGSDLDDGAEPERGAVAIGTMHLAKGLEFRAVAVMACDDEVVPSQERIESVGDEADLEEVYDTERHLLYVACTRARDQLLVTGVEPASEFLADLVIFDQKAASNAR
jgi:superfamily I DNA/RNA helicase